MHPVQRFMRVFFNLLYHPFAFTYDLVAALVSFGAWRSWTESVLPLISGTRILELGHGPGHLQRSLLDLDLAPVAMDESAQMGALARHRLGSRHKLTRGLAQRLPFAGSSFDCIVSTFPTEYIFDARTLSEIGRCLSDGGRLVVLPVAWPRSGVLQWLYRVTGEIPPEKQASLRKKMMGPFIEAGFNVGSEILELRSGTLMFIVATKGKNHV